MTNGSLMGGIGGAATGASTGFSISPTPWGAGIGAGLGLIGGLMQAGQQKKRMAEYGRTEAAIQPVDPNQAAFLNRLRQQERFYRAGTDASSAFARQDQANALAQTQANITRMGGGINQLLRSQQMANMGQAAIGAQASRMADPMLAAQGNLTNMIAQRQYEVSTRNRDMAMARMGQGRQDLMNLFAGGIASIPQMGMAFGKKAPSTFDPMRPGVTMPTGPMYGPDLPVERMAPRGYTAPTAGANDLIWR